MNPEEPRPEEVVAVTEIDAYGNERKKTFEHCRIQAKDDGTLTLVDDRDVTVHAWAPGWWVRVGTRPKKLDDDV